MSKRELKIYLRDLTAKQMREQLVDLYTRFKDVKEFYDFAFNPKEEKLSQGIKFLISKEYFPLSSRKAKTRRSVAQKRIKHIKKLGVHPSIIADIMLFNIEIAQTYSKGVFIKSESFYKSFLKSFEESVLYITENNLKHEFIERLENISEEVLDQDWINASGFHNILDEIK